MFRREYEIESVGGPVTTLTGERREGCVFTVPAARPGRPHGHRRTRHASRVDGQRADRQREARATVAADVPPDVPLPVSVFALYVVLVNYEREATAAAASSGS